MANSTDASFPKDQQKNCSKWVDLFKSYDKSNDGFLKGPEVTQFLEDLCPNHHVTYEDFMEHCDTNKDGKLSLEEFCDALRDFYAQCQMVHLFRARDSNGDGVIDEKEFLDAMTTMETRGHKTDMYKDLFKKYDKDGDGKVNYSEFVQSLKRRH